MVKISIASLTMRVRRKYSRSKEYLDFGRFNGRDSLHDEWRLFLDRAREQHSHVESAKSVLRVLSLTSEEEAIWGTIKAGDYGYTSELIDVVSNVKAYDRQANEAELLPFYFMLDAPANSTKGLVLLQRHGARGIQSLLLPMFKRFFYERHPDYHLEFNPHVPGAVLRYILDGDLQSITLVSYRVPTDLAEKVHLTGNFEDDAVVRTEIKARRNRALPKPRWLRELLNGDRNLFESRGEQLQMADEVKVTVKYNGNQRTVDFRRPDNIAPYIDCSEEVTVGEDGHPVFESIHEYARLLRNDLWAEIGGR